MPVGWRFLAPLLPRSRAKPRSGGRLRVAVHEGLLPFPFLLLPPLLCLPLPLLLIGGSSFTRVLSIWPRSSRVWTKHRPCHPRVRREELRSIRAGGSHDMSQCLAVHISCRLYGPLSRVSSERPQRRHFWSLCEWPPHVFLPALPSFRLQLLFRLASLIRLHGPAWTIVQTLPCRTVRPGVGGCRWGSRLRRGFFAWLLVLPNPTWPHSGPGRPNPRRLLHGIPLTG